MRELFIEELESVVGGQKIDLDDYVQSTMACCEETPFGCCPWWTWVDDIVVTGP